MKYILLLHQFRQNYSMTIFSLDMGVESRSLTCSLTWLGCESHFWPAISEVKHTPRFGNIIFEPAKDVDSDTSVEFSFFKSRY